MNRRYILPVFGVAAVVATLVGAGWFIQKARSAALLKQQEASARTLTLRRVTPPNAPEAGHLVDTTADAAFQAGLTEYRRKRYLEAIPHFYRATTLDPSAPAPHYLLGICYLMTNDTRPAIRELRIVVNLDEPKYGEPAHYFLAKAYVRQGDRVDASQELDSLINSGRSDLKKQAEELKASLASD